MNPQEQNPAYDPKQRVGNELEVNQPGEVKICEIKRHPIGIVSIHVMSGIMLIIIAVLAFGVVPHFATGTDSSSQTTKIGVLVFLVAAIIAAIYNLIATRVYWGNKWVVTSDSVTQVQQADLFTRHSSQLALTSIEDVTAEQNGMLAQMFKFGVLKVETAGHREKFSFIYCPNPNFYAREILQAREVMEQKLRATEEQAEMANYQQYQQYQQMPPPPAQTPPPAQQPPAGPPPPPPGFSSNV